MRENLQALVEGEEPILVIRKHWLIQSFPVIFGSLMILLVLAASLILPLYFPFLLKPPFINFLIIGVSAFLLAFALFIFIQWFNNYFDINIITTKRIIDIEQEGIFKRKISEFPLERIQDVTARCSGIFQTYLNFGDVYIQTAGETPNFTLHLVPKPYLISKKIIEIHHEFSGRKKENGL